MHTATFSYLKALVLMVLKNHIAIFSTTNTKKHVAMLEGRPKNLAIQCIAKDG